MQVCGRCGQSKDEGEFSPSYRGQRGTWCRACFAAYNRMRKLGVTPPASDYRPSERVCGHCGDSFTPRYDKAITVYCSPDCKDRSLKNRAIAARLAGKPERWCMWCGAEMPRSMRSDARYCSADCNMQAHRRTRNLRRRAGAAAPRKPRYIPLLNFAELAELHDWRCGLCGELVDMTLAHPDPLAPSVDHVLPRSLGGADDVSNLQLAHLVCNLRKRNVVRSP